MSHSEPALAILDQWIAAAYSDLGVYRARFDDTPSGEAARACEAAEARLNELLQQRFTATHRSEPAVDPVAGGAWPTSLAG